MAPSLAWLLASATAVLAADFDVVVYGATSGGITAAVSARRHGMKVALVAPGTHVGGLSTSGLGHTDTGGHTNIIGGLAGDFYSRNGAHYGKKVEYNLEPHVAKNIFMDLLKEANVELVLSSRVASVQKSGAHIETLTTMSGRKFSAAVFIDASYEGDLMALSGVSSTFGREGRNEYNESLAGHQVAAYAHQFSVRINPFDDDGKPLPFLSLPTQAREGDADRLIQSYNFRLCVTKEVDNQVPFPRPVGYDPAQWEFARRYFNHPKIAPKVHAPCGNIGGYCGGAIPNGKMDLNNGGPVSTDLIGGNAAYPEASDLEREVIWQAHKNYTLGFLYFMSHDEALPEHIKVDFRQWGFCRDEFEETEHFPPLLYVREVRRMVSDHVFTQNTPAEHRKWGELSIGMGGYQFDSHNAERWACATESDCQGQAPPGKGPYMWNEGDVETPAGVYEIPLWITLPRRREAENLLVVATPSASHIGMSTLRMEPQFMIIGHSAGVVAALAVNSSSAVHDVDTGLLYGLLVADGQVLSLPSPTPAPPFVQVYTVSGAGTAAVNGDYRLDSSQQRDAGTAFYQLDGQHQLYRVGGTWRLAWSDHALFYVANDTGVATPPKTGWATSIATTGADPAPSVSPRQNLQLV